MSLRDVAEGGDHLATLRALRDYLAAELDTSESKRDTAALAARLVDVLGQIVAAEKALPRAKGTALDEITARRAARAPGKAGAAGA